MGWDSSLDPTTAPARLLMAAWKDMTPEERSTEMKRRRKVAKENAKNGKRPKKSTRKNTRKGGASDDGSTQAHTHEEDHSFHIHFLAGSLAKEITNYAASSGVPRAVLAEGVRGLLQ